MDNRYQRGSSAIYSRKRCGNSNFLAIMKSAFCDCLGLSRIIEVPQIQLPMAKLDARMTPTACTENLPRIYRESSATLPKVRFTLRAAS